MSAAERGRLMYKFTDLIESNIEELSYLEALDNGKAYKIAQSVDFFVVLNVLRYFAGWADKI